LGLDCLFGLKVEDLRALEVNSEFLFELGFVIKLGVELVELFEDLFVKYLVYFVLIDLGLLALNGRLLLVELNLQIRHLIIEFMNLRLF
jgi:hypothetical protein